MKSIGISSAALAAVLLAGCGGGGAGTAGGSPTEGGKEMDFGSLAATGFVSGEPVTAGSASSKFIGLTGAFSRIQVRDASPSIDETVIAFSTSNTSIYTVQPDGGNEQHVATEGAFPLSMAFNKTGNRLYYLTGGALRYATVPGGIATGFMNSASPTAMSLSPDSTKIAYTEYVSADAQYDVFISNLDGSGKVRVTEDDVAETGLCWVNENTLAYENGPAVFLRNTDGSNPRQLSPAGGTAAGPERSPDGQWVAYRWRPTGAPYSVPAVVHLNIWGGGDGGAIADLGSDCTLLAWGPDGKRLAAHSADGKITMLGREGANLGTVPYAGDRRSIYDLAWSPFVTDRMLVGGGGTLGNACAGMIFSQVGPKTKAVATFDATTRNTVKIASDDQNTNSPNVIYTAEADQITKIAYTADAQFRTVAIAPPAGVNGILFSFDASNGMVAAVVTYNVNRSSGVRATRKGAETVIEGEIVNVYDRNGKELGPTTRVVVGADGSIRN